MANISNQANLTVFRPSATSGSRANLIHAGPLLNTERTLSGKQVDPPPRRRSNEAPLGLITMITEFTIVIYYLLPKK